MPHSIRWRLPLSYALIALLATLALSLMLIVTLQVYFRQNEATYLYQNAQALSRRLAPLLAADHEHDTLKSQIGGFAFLLQTRVRILDGQREVLVDSGLPDPLYIDLVMPDSPGQEPGADAPYLIVKRQPAELGLSRDAQDALPALPTVQLPDVPSDPQSGNIGLPPPPPAPPPAPLPSTNLLLGFVLGPEATRTGERSTQTVITPIVDPATEQTVGFVELSAGPAYGRELVQRAALVIVLASIVATAVAAVVGWSVSRRMTFPLLALTNATTSMAAGDLSIRANSDRNDEIGALAQSFNVMAHRIEEIVTTLRRFVADAAHELNTPLTALRTHLELALDDASPAEQAQFLEHARRDVERLEHLANDLLDLSRLEAGPSSHPAAPLDLVQVLCELEELYSSSAEQKNVLLSFQVPDERVSIRGDEGQVRRALINVLENALKFTPAGGLVHVSVDVAPHDVFVQVQDTGIGIPDADLPHVFSRFHRSRNSAAYPGSGLGLAIVKAIVVRHGGDISVQSNGQGTSFKFRWPRQHSERVQPIDGPAKLG